MHLKTCFLLLSFTVSSLYAQEIEIFLKNGDRLQGELLIESDDHLTIQHPILGEIEVAKSDLAEIPLALEQMQSQQIPGTAGPEYAPDGEKLETPGVPEQEADEDKLIAWIPKLVWNSPRELVDALKRMNAKLGLSFAEKSAKRDQTDLRFFYNSKWKNGKSEYRFNTDYRFSERDGETNDNRYTGNFRFRMQQQRNLFIQATTFYRKDPIQEINHWAEQGIGAGWRNKVSPSFEYSAGGEISIKWEDLLVDNATAGGFQYLSSIFQDSVLQLTQDYQLVQEAEAYISPDDVMNWGYRFDLNLDGKITKDFSVRLGYEYNYDNLVPRNVPKTETLFSSSILYTF